MSAERALNTILNTNSKVRILRLFISKREDFVASGREVARLIEVTPPAAHTALKDLYNQDILKREIIGKQHLYKLNTPNRIVKNILIPAFTSELSIRKDIATFLKDKIAEKKLKSNIISLLLYGSLQTGSTDEKSDIDIAVITKSAMAKQHIEQIFTDHITNEFYDYFGIHLDVYVKTKDEFMQRLKKNLPPVSTLMQGYSVIYGKDLLDIKK